MKDGCERLTDRISIGVLTRVFPRDLVDEVVAQSGRKERRSRLLPAHVVVYYVMALGLFFGDGYEEVMRRVVGGLRYMRNWSDNWKVPTTSAIAQARARLGASPLAELFHRAAVPLATRSTPSAWFNDLRVMAIDGVVLDAPDTVENAEEFGYSRSGRGDSAFSHVRIVGLAECGTHALVSAELGTSHDSEHTLAGRIVGDIEPGMLILADRGLYSHKIWTGIQGQGAEALFRVGVNMVFPVLEELPDGSFRSILLDREIQRTVRKRALQLGDGPHGNPKILEKWGTPCRVIEYTVGDNTEIIRLITSIMNHDEAPAVELATLYHERWEFELLLDEIEIHQLGHGRVLRSKTPEMVKQEIWGILLTHYAIRHLMLEAADMTEERDPDRISFIKALRIARRHTTSQSGFSPSQDNPITTNRHSRANRDY